MESTNYNSNKQTNNIEYRYIFFFFFLNKARRNACLLVYITKANHLNPIFIQDKKGILNTFYQMICHENNAAHEIFLHEKIMIYI